VTVTHIGIVGAGAGAAAAAFTVDGAVPDADVTVFERSPAGSVAARRPAGTAS